MLAWVKLHWGWCLSRTQPCLHPCRGWGGHGGIRSTRGGEGACKWNLQVWSACCILSREVYSLVGQPELCCVERTLHFHPSHVHQMQCLHLAAPGVGNLLILNSWGHL